VVLNRHKRRLTPWNLGITTAHSPPSLKETRPEIMSTEGVTKEVTQAPHYGGRKSG
jgi:hypothetical protein